MKNHVVVATSTNCDAKSNILVVDDAHIRELLRQSLTANGYCVDEAEDGVEAIAFVKHKKPDLIILDIMMPKINGFDVATILRNDPETRHIPILILSIVEDQKRGYQLGIDSYLTKPINLID